MSHSSQNSKSILAKALAEENIKVFHDPSLETAMFDVANRTLMLPMWENISSECYDLLVGHEIGHALYTPDIDAGKSADCVDGPWTSVAEKIGGNVHASYVQGIMNIVEDVRIERMVKEKYPGLRRDFAIGYREMFEKDFFGTNGKEISKLAFADRINLHFKVGNHLIVPFSAEEQKIVDSIERNMSFDGTCTITEEIFNFIGGTRTHVNRPKQSNGATRGNQNGSAKDNFNGVGQRQNSNNPSDGDGNSETLNQGNNTGSDESNGTDGDTHNQNNSMGSAPSGAGTGQVLEQMTTQNSFDDKQKKNISSTVKTSNYYEIPTPCVKNIVVPYGKVNHYLSNYFSNTRNSGSSYAKFMDRIDEKYSRLMSNARPLIGQLIQQFDMKKAADEQKRTTISRSGKLDCDRLCLHKITDDIFMNYSNIADGKNHGMVMVIDWSSSMQMATEDVLTQVVMLSQFCKRMSIPFDVYLFTSQHHVAKACGHTIDINAQWLTGSKIKSFAKKNFDYERHDRYAKAISSSELEHFSLIHVLSSDMKQFDFTNAIKNLFTLGQFVTRPKDLYVSKSNPSVYDISISVNPPTGFGQANTPLDSTIITMMNIVPEFQKKHNVQIVNTIFLTDGETGYSPIRVSHYGGHRREYVSVKSPINEKEYDVSDFQTSTDALLHIFGDVTGSTTIGFFIILHRKGACRYFPNSQDTKQIFVKMQQDGFLDAPKMKFETVYNYETRSYETKQSQVTNHGYDKLFVIPTSSSEEIDDIDDALGELPQNATLTRIRNTFLKAVNNRINSRGFINRFADVIAQPIKR
jgi:hypothetical protein